MRSERGEALPGEAVWVARVSRSDFHVSPFAAVVTTPHVTAHQPPRHRPPRHCDPPQMPEARPSRCCFRRNAVVGRYGHVALRNREVHEHELACFLGFAERCKGRASHGDTGPFVVKEWPRCHKSRPRSVPALVTYRKRIFVAVRVPDLRTEQRRRSAAEIKGHMTLANNKELACQNFRLGLSRREFKADKAPAFSAAAASTSSAVTSRARSDPLIAQPIGYQLAGHARPFRIGRNKTRLLSLMSAFRVNAGNLRRALQAQPMKSPTRGADAGRASSQRHCRVCVTYHRRAPLTAHNPVFSCPDSHSWGQFPSSSGRC